MMTSKSLKRSDLASMEADLLSNIDAEKMRKQVNDVKCDAIHTARTYEEFSDRVAAAHLRSLEKKDGFGKRPEGTWNPIVSARTSNEYSK